MLSSCERRNIPPMTPQDTRILRSLIAVAWADGPAEGLALLEAMPSATALEGYYLLHATRADLLRRLGRGAEAAASYRRALALDCEGKVATAAFRTALRQVLNPLPAKKRKG